MNNQRKYDREFKLNAVKLYHESGKSLETVSSNLGIPLTTLAGWVKQCKPKFATLSHRRGSRIWVIHTSDQLQSVVRFQFTASIDGA